MATVINTDLYLVTIAFRMCGEKQLSYNCAILVPFLTWRMFEKNGKKSMLTSVSKCWLKNEKSGLNKVQIQHTPETWNEIKMELEYNLKLMWYEILCLSDFNAQNSTVDFFSTHQDCSRSVLFDSYVAWWTKPTVNELNYLTE